MLLIVWSFKAIFFDDGLKLAEKLSLCMLNYKSLFHWLGVLGCLA